MTADERRKDIAGRCGVSEEMVKRVLSSTRASLMDSAKRGERGTLPGICAITVSREMKLVIGGGNRQYLKAKATVASSFKDELEECKITGENSIREAEETGSEIRLRMINSLM